MIDIRTFTVPKNNGNGSISIKVNGGGGGSASSLKPLSLWGQYFDGTEDISGDISSYIKKVKSEEKEEPIFFTEQGVQITESNVESHNKIGKEVK